MTESKISQFSQIIEEFNPSNTKFKSLEDSNFTKISTIILDSSRKSKLMAGVKIITDNQPVENVDENSIKLHRGPVVPRRQFPSRDGILQIYVNTNWCFGFGSNKEKVKCVLLENILTIQQGSSNKKYVCFDAVNWTLIAKGRTQFQLGADGSQVSFILKAESQGEREAWVNDIQKCILQSHSYNKELKNVIDTPMFQQRQWALESQFVESCNSGDILLFKSEHTYGKLQQMLTMSDYDHVGIVLKNKKNEVIIFQSNSSEGVSFVFWKQLIYHGLYKGIPRLAWRKLSMQRTEKDISLMEDFVRTNLHKEFQINVDKIFRLQSKIHKTAEQEKERTYFCSQLVAAFYKKLGILSQQKATTQYWPVSFSDSRTLDLVRGRLEKEKILVFEESVIDKRRNKNK